MSKKIKLPVALVCALLLLLSTFGTAFAETQVNGVSVKKGDVLTFTVNIKPLDVTLAAFNLQVNYDSSVLELDKDSASAPAFEGRSICNVNEANIIYANAVDGINGFKITENTQMLGVKFKVIDDSKSCDITYEILELFDLDLVAIDPEKNTFSNVEVNGSASIGTQSATTQNEVTSQNETLEPEQQSHADSEQVESQVLSGIESKAQDSVSSDKSTVVPTIGAEEDNSQNIMWILLGVGVVLVSGLIVTLVVKKFINKKNKSDVDERK